MFNASKVKSDIVQWIRGYFNKPENYGAKAVIGASGGVDSNVDMALCKEALGAENVIVAFMPNGVQHDKDDAYHVVEHLGIPKENQYEINIKPVMDAFYKALEDAGLTANQLVYSNAPARMRSAVLFAITAIVRGRFVNNGNKTEEFLGWRTKGGDTVGDVAPIKELVKREVLAVGRETELLPRHVDKVPEDGLSGTSDEANFARMLGIDEMPTGELYDLIDDFIRDKAHPDAALVEKLLKLNAYGKHKEEAMPTYELETAKTYKVYVSRAGAYYHGVMLVAAENAAEANTLIGFNCEKSRKGTWSVDRVDEDDVVDGVTVDRAGILKDTVFYTG